MDRDELRAKLQRAADALPDGPDDARGGVARRVRRHRRTASLTILAAVLALALAGTVLVLPGSQDGAVEFADSVQPSSAPSDAAAVTDPAVTDDTESATAQGVTVPCRPVDAPPQDGAQLARVYVPCGSSQVGSAPTVAVQYRWVDDRSPTALVGAVFDCPDDAERRAGRVCLLDDPGQKPVSDVTVSGDVAQVTLTAAIRGLAGAGGTGEEGEPPPATIVANAPALSTLIISPRSGRGRPVGTGWADPVQDRRGRGRCGRAAASRPPRRPGWGSPTGVGPRSWRGAVGRSHRWTWPTGCTTRSPTACP